MKIFDMRTMILGHRNEKKINQKFVLLKVASDKKFGQHFPWHSTALRPLSKMVQLLFVYENQIQIVLFYI
jgi:hypothetical protein